MLHFVVYYRPQGEGNVFTGVLSFHNQPHGYSFTARPYGAVGTHPTGMLSCWNFL